MIFGYNSSIKGKEKTRVLQEEGQEIPEITNKKLKGNTMNTRTETREIKILDITEQEAMTIAEFLLLLSDEYLKDHARVIVDEANKLILNPESKAFNLLINYTPYDFTDPESYTNDKKMIKVIHDLYEFYSKDSGYYNIKVDTIKQQKKLRKAITKAITKAYKSGDQDEQFIKHIGHTLSAIYVGNGYMNPVDYSNPGCSDKDMAKLNRCWMKVEKISKKVSKNEFKRIAQSIPMTDYFTDDWYIKEAYEYKAQSA